jgi:hypothetical protein
MVGVTDDMFKLESGRAQGFAQNLGLSGARVSLHWDAGRTTLKPEDAAQLQLAASTGVRVVVSVYGWRDDAPQTDAARDAYCSFVRDLLVQVPRINDIVIWNEPNLSYFWRPQFDATGNSVAPAAYEALLARCWDVLHAYRPSVNVIGFATSPWGTDDPNSDVVVSHAPGTFIRDVGDAYRASGRTAPIVDTVSHHIYGASPVERPWVRHTSSTRISEGDVGKLVDALQTAFTGTKQAAPGLPVDGRTVSIWYLESGFETVPAADKASFYVNQETTAALPDFTGALPWASLPDSTSRAPDQATQLRDALRLAYCQPYVGAIFNFLLQDQPELNLWQSGVLWADGTPKASYAVWRSTIDEVRAGAVNCALFAAVGGQPPADDTPPASQSTAPPAEQPKPPAVVTPAKKAVLALSWARKVNRAYARRNRAWGVAVRATLAAPYVATVQTAKGTRRLTARGGLHQGATAVRFPGRRLALGSYRVVVRAGGQTLRSALFRVQ